MRIFSCEITGPVVFDLANTYHSHKTVTITSRNGVGKMHRYIMFENE